MQAIKIVTTRIKFVTKLLSSGTCQNLTDQNLNYCYQTLGRPTENFMLDAPTIFPIK